MPRRTCTGQAEAVDQDERPAACHKREPGPVLWPTGLRRPVNNTEVHNETIAVITSSCTVSDVVRITRTVYIRTHSIAGLDAQGLHRRGWRCSDHTIAIPWTPAPMGCTTEGRVQCTSMHAMAWRTRPLRQATETASESFDWRHGMRGDVAHDRHVGRCPHGGTTPLVG